ncbi:MAG TPA: hypothetical protein V6D17_10340 [Candidatus Obscuribacterales bacterium]
MTASERHPQTKQRLAARLARLAESTEPFFFRAMIPMATATFMAGLVSSIWLAALGEWEAIILGLVGVYILPWTLYLLLLPCWIPQKLAQLAPNNKLLQFTMDLVILLWISFLTTSWCMSILVHFPTLVHKTAAVPIVLWCYAVAITPCIRVAYKYQDDVRTMVGLFIVQVLYLSVLVLVHARLLPISSAGLLFLITVWLCAFVQAALRVFPYARPAAGTH